MDSKNPSGAKGRAEVYDWIQCIIFALVFCVLLFVFAVRMVNVVGHSMVPTLEQNDKVIISNLFYHPKQGDIVVLRKQTLMEEPIVKRIIATEGQTVDIDFEDGVVYVDGGNVTDANPVVIRDRQKLAQDGVVSVTVAISGKRKNVSAVEVTCRGISFGSDEELMEEARATVRAQADKLANSDGASIDSLRRNVRNSVSNLFWNKTHTRPMVIPVVLEV